MEAEDGEGSELGSDTEQKAGAAGDERNSGEFYRKFTLRHAFGFGVGRHGFGLAEMIDSVVEEEAAEYHATDKKGCFHGFVLRSWLLGIRCEGGGWCCL